MASQSLFIIEAPGKRKTLAQALRNAGVRNFDIIATVGHIGTNPEGFKPLAIDNAYNELAYRLKPERENIAQQIALAAKNALNIYLATDDDHEGDVIARDVMRFCVIADDHAKALRLRLRSLAPSEVKQALNEASPFDKLLAAKGDARRVIDRLIGSLSSDQGAVGRVQGSLLLELQNNLPVAGVVTLCATSADSGKMFSTKYPLYSGQDIPDQFVFDVGLEPGAKRLVNLANKPYSHDEILLAVSLATDSTIGDVSSSMQGLYEDGQMTYPRSSSKEVTPEALRRIMAISRANGAGFASDEFTSVREEGAKGHEAPNPAILGVPVNRDLSLLTQSDQVLVVLTRKLIECGVKGELQLANNTSLQQLPTQLQGLRWQRVDTRNVIWDKSEKPGFTRWTNEQSLLHFMSKNDLGRPSTVVNHISKILSRELLTHELELTKKGREWSANVGEIFNHQNISKIIENYIENHQDEPNKMVEEMVKLCNLSFNDLEQRQEFDNDNEDYEISTW